MDPVQLDFYISCVPLGLAMLMSLLIMVRVSIPAGLLMLFPCAFLLGHMYITTFASDQIATFEQVLNPGNEIVSNLIFERWYKIFLLAKAASYCGLPCSLWLLYRRIVGTK